MHSSLLGRRAFLKSIGASCLLAGSPLLAQQRRPLRWSAQDQLDFAAFVPNFAAQSITPVDCADLAIDSLITFASERHLPVRLFDFDGPPGRRKRWLTYDPRRDDWRRVRAYLMQQLGAVNVIENSNRIELSEVRAGDLIMHEYPDALGYTGHTRVLISARYDAERRDYFTRRYEGTMPPVVPQLREGWFSEIDNVYENKPRRWNFGQFAMA